MPTYDPLPQTTLDAIERGDTVVTLPHGEYTLPGLGIQPKPGTRRIVGHGCTLIPTGIRGFHVVSTLVNPPSETGNEKEWHASGKVTIGTDHLILEDGCPLEPGETVLVRLGVRATDPNEPVREVWMTVKEVVDGKVYFVNTFSENIKVWESYDALRAASFEGQHYKIAEWGDWLGHGIGRGFGLDHGVYKFDDLIEDLTIEGVSIRWEHSQNGSASIALSQCRNITIRDLYVENPRSKTVHSSGTDDLLVEGVTIRGEGKGWIWNQPSTVAHACTAWGGTNHVYRNVDIDASGVCMFGFERGTRQIVFENMNYRSRKVGTYKVGLFGSSPQGDPVIMRNCRFDFEGADHYFSAGAPVTVLEDCEFTRPLEKFVNFHESGAYQNVEFRGRVTIAGKRYEPWKTERRKVTCDAPSVPIELPPGIYREVRVKVEQTGSVRAIQWSGGTITLDEDGEGEATQRIRQLPPGFPAPHHHYYPTVMVWMVAPDERQPTKVTVEYEYMKQEN